MFHVGHLELQRRVVMLLLSRRIGEAVMIGAGVKVVVLDVRGGQVRLGIEAPRDVVVDREEVHKRKKQQEQLGCEAVGRSYEAI